MKTKIDALILDFGRVISQPPDQTHVNNMRTVLKLDPQDFAQAYLAHREAYDSGHLSGSQYWSSVMQQFGLNPGDFPLERLIEEDVKSWTRIDDQMIAFVREARPLLPKMAILSNMTKDTAEFIAAHFPWLSLFDELVYSYVVGFNKPSARIYENCLERLQTAPENCLFVDDSLPNVLKARELNIHAIHYRSFPEFRKELDEKYRFAGADLKSSVAYYSTNQL